MAATERCAPARAPPCSQEARTRHQILVVPWLWVHPSPEARRPAQASFASGVPRFWVPAWRMQRQRAQLAWQRSAARLGGQAGLLRLTLVSAPLAPPPALLDDCRMPPTRPQQWAGRPSAVPPLRHHRRRRRAARSGAVKRWTRCMRMQCALHAVDPSGRRHVCDDGANSHRHRSVMHSPSPAVSGAGAARSKCARSRGLCICKVQWPRSKRAQVPMTIAPGTVEAADRTPKRRSLRLCVAWVLKSCGAGSLSTCEA